MSARYLILSIFLGENRGRSSWTGDPDSVCLWNYGAQTCGWGYSSSILSFEVSFQGPLYLEFKSKMKLGIRLFNFRTILKMGDL